MERDLPIISMIIITSKMHISLPPEELGSQNILLCPPAQILFSSLTLGIRLNCTISSYQLV